MDRHLPLLTRLADGRFHSGQALAEHVGITRAAVWKRLRGLAEETGLELHAVRGRGYRLARPLELLDRARLLAELSAHNAAIVDLLLLPRIDSTSAYLQREVSAAQRQAVACLAEQQTAGRGRRGRGWVSPFASNIYLSLAYRFDLPVTALAGLSVMVGAVLGDRLRRIAGDELGLKWPNDVHWRERKLAGILVEVAGETDGPSRAIIGVGINVRMPATQARDIDQPWVDLATVANDAAVSRNAVAGQVLQALLDGVRRFEAAGLAPFIDDWRRLDLYMHRSVTVQHANGEIAGVHRGIDSAGALLLDTGEGVQRVHAGEVSLRAASATGFSA